MKNTLAPPLQQIDRTYVLFKGRKYSYFAGCDYYRLSSHPNVMAAIREGMERYGLNTSASRKTTGNHELYHRLEKAIARYFGAQNAVIFSAGYVTNLAVAQSLQGEFSHVLIDERSHLSQQDAAKAFEARIIPFKHRNAEDLAKKVKQLPRSARIILQSDGLFAADGTVAPLQAYHKVLPKTAWMLIDDAHGGGIIGRTGKGSVEVEGLTRERVIQTVTLSKAFGVFGGAVVGNRDVCEKIMERSCIFTGNTPLPLALANGALKAIEILRSDATFRARLDRNALFAKCLLSNAGIPIVESSVPIISIVPKTSEKIARLRKQLLNAGIYPSFIKYPGGAAGGHFRFVISSEHSREQLSTLAEVLMQHAR